VTVGILIADDADAEVELDDREANELFAITESLEAATVSACPSCRSRVVAAMALVDLLDTAPPFARGNELIELADDAPTLHLYVVDLATSCAHTRWRDPLFDEWADAVEGSSPEARR
jgi:hypothetical protein